MKIVLTICHWSLQTGTGRLLYEVRGEAEEKVDCPKVRIKVLFPCEARAETDETVEDLNITTDQDGIYTL